MKNCFIVPCFILLLSGTLCAQDVDDNGIVVDHNEQLSPTEELLNDGVDAQSTEIPEIVVDQGGEQEQDVVVSNDSVATQETEEKPWFPSQEEIANVIQQATEIQHMAEDMMQEQIKVVEEKLATLNNKLKMCEENILNEDDIVKLCANTFKSLLAEKVDVIMTSLQNLEQQQERLLVTKKEVADIVAQTFDTRTEKAINSIANDVQAAISNVLSKDDIIALINEKMSANKKQEELGKHGSSLAKTIFLAGTVLSLACVGAALYYKKNVVA